MAYAHGRMSALGHQRSDVVTQTENEGACRLYRGAGYTPVKPGRLCQIPVLIAHPSRIEEGQQLKARQIWHTSQADQPSILSSYAE